MCLCIDSQIPWCQLEMIAKSLHSDKEACKAAKEGFKKSQNDAIN